MRGISGRRHARTLILDYHLAGQLWDTVHPITEPTLPLAMHPSEHRLRQLDEAYLRSLDVEALRNRSARWLADPKDARARLDARSAGRSHSPQRPAPSERQRNQAKLLRALERPDLPIHNNRRETDLRDVVKKRQISAGTRSADGRRCRDPFASLKKTCRKQGVSFWAYLQDRVAGLNVIPSLAELIRQPATP